MEFIKDKLTVKIYGTREEMGKAAASECATRIRELLSEKEEVNMIFAAAPSQNEMLDSLCKEEGIEWTRVNAFHMDEYVGLSEDAPQRFATFLKEHIFSRLPFKSVNTLNPTDVETDAECERYSSLLKAYPTDIVCMGIGENGHIAFNDPHVADFNDSALVKKVSLDEVCRNQQVNDGCFKALSDVPKYALTLTIPALMNAKYHFCVVPAKTKREAVRNTVLSEVSEACPATILRRKENAALYLDSDSAEYLLESIE